MWIIIFYELRKMYADFSVVVVRPATVQISSHDTVEEFWKKVLRGENSGQREQIVTTISWLDGQAGRRENVYSWLASGPVSAEYRSCCPCYTLLNDEQWEDEEIYIHDVCSSHGALCLWQARRSEISPLRCVDYSVSFGWTLWDFDRHLEQATICGLQCPLSSRRRIGKIWSHGSWIGASTRAQCKVRDINPAPTLARFNCQLECTILHGSGIMNLLTLPQLVWHIDRRKNTGELAQGKEACLDWITVSQAVTQ